MRVRWTASAWWIPATLRGYRAGWLGADALAGLTLVAVVLPGQMATARLAGLPAVSGLLAFVAGPLAYALLGTSRQLSVGADSTIAPVLATGVAAIAVASGYGVAMAFTALLVGAALIAVGVFRLGWIADFLSTPVITGVLAGIAVEIVVRQLPAILGVAGGATSTLGELRRLGGQLSHVNGWSLGISAGVLAVIVVAQRIDHRLPGPLAGLILSIVAAHAFGLAARHGVPVLGVVHGGLPHLRLPYLSWSQLRRLSGLVLTVTFVCIAQTAATVRSAGTRARGAGAPVDFNRDLMSIGAGSVAAGLIGAFPVDASPPNTALATTAGTRSQLANIMAAAGVLGVVLVATGPLADLPEAMLAATLVFIATKLFRVGELRAILRFDRLEFGLAAVTFRPSRCPACWCTWSTRRCGTATPTTSTCGSGTSSMPRELATDLRQQGVSMEIARASHLVHHDLKHGTLLAQLGPGHLFDSVQAAVSAGPPGSFGSSGSGR